MELRTSLQRPEMAWSRWRLRSPSASEIRVASHPRWELLELSDNAREGDQQLARQRERDQREEESVRRERTHIFLKIPFVQRTDVDHTIQCTRSLPANQLPDIRATGDDVIIRQRLRVPVTGSNTGVLFISAPVENCPRIVPEAASTAYKQPS
jgi:hypothetical protein